MRVGRAALAMRSLDPADPALDGQRLGDWLAKYGQDERTRRVLWDLFTVSSLNIAGDDASLALAATVIKTALLGEKDAADIGVPAVPLGELHGTAGLALLRPRRRGAAGRQGSRGRTGRLTVSQADATWSSWRGTTAKRARIFPVTGQLEAACSARTEW